MAAQTPVSFNANEVIAASLRDLGVLAASATPHGWQSVQALKALNLLITMLRTQEFSVPFISRQVFPITALQNTYTIGPGGDLDTERPQQIDGCGLLLTPDTGSFAITGASVSNRTFTVAGDQTGSFPSGSDFLVSGSTGNDGNYTIISAVFGSATVISVSEAVPSAVVDGTITTLTDANATTEIPIGVITDNAYQAIRVKGMQNTQFTQCYYNPTYQGGLGLIWLWPKPTVSYNALVLYLDDYVATFPDLVTNVWFPPGYFDIFEYGLGKRLCLPYGKVGSPEAQEIAQNYATALNLVKRQNVKRNDMPNEAAAITGPGGIYNILSGTIQ